VRYQGLEDPGEATIYTPFDQTPFLWTYVFVRTRGEPSVLTRAIASAVTTGDPDLVPARIRPMSAVVGEAVKARRSSALLLAAFAAVALLLAAIGIGGLVSYAVGRRTSEMAVRLALGATPGRVLVLVLSQALVPVAGGALVGLLVSVAATRLLESLLFGITPHDGWTFAAAAAGLAFVTLGAAWLPARRALGIEPADALRVQ
jgi:ABC-type antimicrobial peptide transport system permease subunit